MSIESQRRELARVFASQSMEIVATLEEAKSAKAPGRPIFNDMITRIVAGEADGIVAWAPDRLSRNSVDGGRVIFLLDTGVIRDLKFASYTFENNSQGKFMLSIMFGQSKYYSDALSENVKRGNRTKVENGWRPNLAPLGYVNDPATKTIVPDPIHFPLIRQMFDLLLTGAYSPRQIGLMARDDWGFTTPRRRKIGGVPLSMSSVYKILGNPFYAGIIHWDGQVYAGKHKPVVSVDEFERARKLLARPSLPRAQKHTFSYTGLMRCGACARMITAEHKTNRFGSRYVYYHCVKRPLGPRCSQPSVELASLERQFVEFLSSLQIRPLVGTWLIEALKGDEACARETLEARRRSLERAQGGVRSQLIELTGMRMRALLSDEEFLLRRKELQTEELRLGGKISEILGSKEGVIEPLMDLVLFSNQAAEWFQRGDSRTKRLILETVGSNPTSAAKKVSMQAVNPFVVLLDLACCPRLLAAIEDVRTFPDNASRYDAAAKVIAKAARKIERSISAVPRRDAFIENLRCLREQCGPPHERLLPPHRATAA